ncbi:flagellar hook-length control protein FliK, partial [Pseudothermotoga sp.]|uniref:flagellar hook-length control protein FliK n=1 Tax=Pseudothermotoga sp. TaxID=2033661 RepID=UPI0031F652BC
LTVARELKQTAQEQIQEKVEGLEKTERMRETLNIKAAKRVYEREQPIVQHVRIEHRDIDQVIVRVEQQQRADNLQTIAETIKQMRETLTEKAEVQLSPPTLGKLEIELVKQQDRLTVLMRVSTPEAKELLENNSKELASRLSNLGFKVEQIEVRFNPKFEQEKADEEREHNQQFEHHEQQRKKQESDEDDQRD